VARVLGLLGVRPVDLGRKQEERGQPPRRHAQRRDPEEGRSARPAQGLARGPERQRGHAPDAPGVERLGEGPQDHGPHRGQLRYHGVCLNPSSDSAARPRTASPAPA
jgi:hypothetical protein